jgi:hypothetical protein
VTTPHVKPYPLGWMCEYAKLQVRKQCKFRFAITSKFIDEVELDVVPLEICGISIDSPYLYDRKEYSIVKRSSIIFSKIGLNMLLEITILKLMFLL